MPKRAKKGGGGGGKTEGERLLFLQQRAQAEEEMAKKKEEILTLYLKDKLQKEERNTAVNLMKLNDGWRSILRQTRAAELRRDIMVLRPTFERQLDALDNIIKNLGTDLQEAERASAQVRRGHLQHLDRLLALQHQQLGSLQQRWEGGLQQLSSRFISDRRETLRHSEQQRGHLEDTVFAMTRQHEDETTEIQTLFDAIIESYKEAVQDHQTECLHEKQTNELKVEKKRVREAKKTCRSLKNNQEKMLKGTDRYLLTVQTHLEQVKKIQDTVIHLRKKLIFNEAKHQSTEQDLVTTETQKSRSTHELQNQLLQARAAARKQLTDLTLQSDAAAKKLKAVIAKGERVVRAAEMCQKMEDKVRLLLRPEELRQEPGAGTEDPAEQIPELRHLTRRMNAIVLQREALQKHKQELTRENQQLKLLLHQHLDAMTVSGQHLDQRHALLTIDPAPLSNTPPTTRTHHTVIEGVHAIKHSQ